MLSGFLETSQEIQLNIQVFREIPPDESHTKSELRSTCQLSGGSRSADRCQQKANELTRPLEPSGSSIAV